MVATAYTDGCATYRLKYLEVGCAMFVELHDGCYVPTPVTICATTSQVDTHRVSNHNNWLLGDESSSNAGESNLQLGALQTVTNFFSNIYL
jgi:hypothetical protein